MVAIRLWLVVSLLLLIHAGVAPSLYAHSEESTISIRTYTPITVDGTLDDWVRRLESSNWAGQMEVKKGKVLEWVRAVPAYLNALTSRIEAGRLDSADDFSATVYTMWDEKRLYVAAIVRDDQIVAQHEGQDIWQDDAIELWLDCRHDAVTHTLFQEDEYQIGFSPASRDRNKAVAWVWRNPDPNPVIQGIAVASSTFPKGYIIEASVPWAAMHGCRPSIGTMMGFNISAVDKDEDQLWTHITWSGHLHSDPSQFGHLYFVDAPVDLFPSDVFESTSRASPWEPPADAEPGP